MLALNLGLVVRSVVVQIPGVEFNGSDSEYSSVYSNEYGICVRLKEIVQKPADIMAGPLVLSYQVKLMVPKTADDDTDKLVIIEALGRAIADKRDMNKQAVRQWLDHE